MSTQRLAILAAVGTHNLMRNTSESGAGGSGTERHHHGREQYQATDHQQRSPNGNQFHGNVNVLLGGAMLSVVVTMVCFVCYCCHRNLRKRSETVYRQRWFDADANMEIYSVAQCYDLSPEQRTSATAAGDLMNHQPASLTPSLAMSAQGPPPSYDTVVAMDQSLDGCDKCARLPRRCSFANCNLLHQQHPDHTHNCRCPFIIKADGDLDNNANQSDLTRSVAAAAVAAPGAATPNSAQILNVLGVPSTSPAPCNCDLYQACDGIEFVRRCKHCGSDIDGNYYCDCYATVPVSSPANGDADRSAGATGNTSIPNGAAGVDDNANALDNANGGTAVLLASPAAAVVVAEPIERSSTSANNNRADGASNEQSSDNGPTGGAGAVATAAAAAAPLQCAANCACTAHHHRGNNNQHPQQQRQQQCGCCSTDNNRNVDLDAFNAAGLIRMDMSQIIDQTGLPTYEAALKFESSGYV